MNEQKIQWGEKPCYMGNGLEVWGILVNSDKVATPFYISQLADSYHSWVLHYPHNNSEYSVYLRTTILESAKCSAESKMLNRF